MPTVEQASPHTISVVIPIYQAEGTIREVIAELEPYFTLAVTDAGHEYVVSEVLLVYDNGPDASDEVIRELAANSSRIRPVWLSRNFGQHAATLAGMASSGGDWIVTLDEDGQHNPADIAKMLDVAMRAQVPLVYAEPTNEPPHGLLRNTASRGAKWVVQQVFRFDGAEEFTSFRLVLGEVGRSVAAYSGAGVYLDVAMRWVTGRTARCPVELRPESGRKSGYSLRTLASHFWRMVLSSGTRGLRLVSIVGMTFAAFGVLLSVYALVGRILGAAEAPGWTSLMIVLSLGFGAVLFSLGVVAEYIGVAVNMAMGRPLYLVTSDPHSGPLGRSAASPGSRAEPDA